MILKDFKQYCISLRPEILVQKYLIENETYFFKEIKKGEEFDFKKDIASILGIHIRDIVIVGSGKFGFSLKPDNSDYMFRPHQKWTITAVPDAGGYLGGQYYKIVIAGTDRALAATADAEVIAVPTFTRSTGTIMAN